MITKFEEIITTAKAKGPKTVAVACAHDDDVLQAVNMAQNEGIAKGILVGDIQKIEEAAITAGINMDNFECIDVKDPVEASLKAVSLVSSGKADLVMKGLVDTSVVLKAVLNKEVGLRTGNVLSHVALFDVPKYHKLLLVTDAAMNIAPDVKVKKEIIENTVEVGHALGIKTPIVGVVCAKEKVNDKMPATVDAKTLSDMNAAGEIKDCIVSGPFALDNAISKEAAKTKGVKHEGAGDCDILLCPDIEAGNILYKSLSFLTDSKNAGIIVGAKAPIVLTSRADSEETKLNSIALGVLIAANK